MNISRWKIVNLGAGSQVFSAKVGANLNFRSLVAGTGVTLVENLNNITISSNSTKSYGEIYCSGTLSQVTTTNTFAEITQPGVITLASGFTNAISYRLTYTGASTAIFMIQSTFSDVKSSTETNICELRKNSLTNTIPASVHTFNKTQSGGAPFPKELHSTTGLVSLATNDYVSLWINATTTTIKDIADISLSATQVS
jgi:hypothetical protein